jgi:DNA-binding response OmpR family regulator
MHVLIIEDDDEKAKDLAQFVRENYAIEEIFMARSFQSGLRSALGNTVNLILLDMTMRNFDRSLEDEGGRPHHFAGLEILRQMQRENIKVPVIVVTNFDRFGEEAEEVTLSELKVNLESRFSDYLGTVHYRSNVDQWKVQLKLIIDSRLPALN